MSIYGDPNGNYLGNANASYNGSELTYNIHAARYGAKAAAPLCRLRRGAGRR